jgi:hypothetical protein
VASAGRAVPATAAVSGEAFKRIADGVHRARIEVPHLATSLPWTEVPKALPRGLPALALVSPTRRKLEKLAGGAANNMTKSATTKGESPSRLIDARIKELGDWRGKTLSHVRALIKQADPEVVEEWKWRGVPVWSHDGLICTGETYKSVVKLTFAKGASLTDPSGLFNSSLEGNAGRAIDLHEGDEVDGDAFKTLIRAAVALNRS